jgi:hypothetical protein
MECVKIVALSLSHCVVGGGEGGGGSGKSPMSSLSDIEGGGGGSGGDGGDERHAVLLFS